MIAHTVLVHETVQHYSKELLSKYRQVNYVTPKHFLGYIMTFLDLIGNNPLQPLLSISICSLECNFTRGMSLSRKFNESIDLQCDKSGRRRREGVACKKE